MPPTASAPSAPARPWSPAWIGGVFALATLGGYFFGRWYMNTGWGLGWRTTQFFFSYQELGFVKRAIVGSVLQPFPALRQNAVFLALSAGFIAIFVGQVTRWFTSASPALFRRDAAWLLAICATSPALFLRQGFDIGRYDVLGFIAVLAGFRALERGRPWLAAAASALALLAHEAYLLINLPLVVAFCLTRADSPEPRGQKLTSLLALPLAVTVLLVLFGRYEAGLDELVRRFGADARYLAAKGGGVDDDALAVLTRGFADNVDFVAEMFWSKKAWLHLPIIAAWLALMTRFFFRFHRDNALPRDLLFYASFTPLLLSAIASDYYRWVALTATNMFIVVLVQLSRLADRGQTARIPTGVATWTLIATGLLGPISNTKSFPLLFLALERVWPGVSW